MRGVPRRSADDALLRVLRSLCAKDLAACAAACRRFTVPAPALGGVCVVEGAARDAARDAGWSHERVAPSWLRALRLTECRPALPAPLGGEDAALHEYNAALLPVDGALAQQPRGGRPAPHPGARCAACGLRGNSWLNLIDGSVLCGRRQFDGSGGNGCALAHAEAAAAAGAPVPLVAKLGTLSADLRAGLLHGDVFSYDLPGAVLLTSLGAHLAHWGVDASGDAFRMRAVPTVAALSAAVDARFVATIARWFALPQPGATAVLRELRDNPLRLQLLGLFAHASRLHRDAARAARAAAQPAPGARSDDDAEAGVQEEDELDQHELPLPPLPPPLLAQMQAHLQLLAAQAAARAAAAAEGEAAEQAHSDAED